MKIFIAQNKQIIFMYVCKIKAQKKKKIMSSICGHVLCSLCLDNLYSSNKSTKQIDCLICYRKLEKK